MAASSSTAGIALLLVSILGVAAVGGVVVYENQDNGNPNSILGSYVVAEYTQGGVGPDGEWHWYETGDGMYDGEIIIIESYDDGFVKGSVYLFDEKYSLNGYYNPDTHEFGYTSYYNYSPEGTDDVVDILYGSIEDNVMILTGYTISAKNASQAFAFNFIFVKNGAPYVNPFGEVTFTSHTVRSSQILHSDCKQESGVGSSYENKEYRNGVYRLEINGKDAAAVTTMNVFDEDHVAVAGTLRCVHIEDDNICVEWIVVSEKTIYSFACDSGDMSKTEFLSNRLMSDMPQLTGVRNASIEVKSSLHSDVDKYQCKFKLSKSGTEAHSMVINNITTERNFIINVWNTSYPVFNHISSMVHTNINGVDYYGDLFGSIIGQKYTLNGVLVSASGETLVMKMTF